MKNKQYLAIAILVLTIVLQRIALQFFRESEYIFPFASGLRLQENKPLFFSELSYMFLPILFMLFVFWDKASDLVCGYGKLIIIRNYSRIKLCLRRLANSALWLLGIVLFQILVFAMPDERWKILEIKSTVLMLGIYYLTLLALISIQYCLEFYIGSERAFGSVGIFFIVSLFAGNVLIENDKTGLVEGIFFPNLAFAPRNNIVPDALVSIQLPLAIASLIIIIVGSALLAALKFSRKDIF